MKIELLTKLNTLINTQAEILARLTEMEGAAAKSPKRRANTSERILHVIEKSDTPMSIQQIAMSANISPKQAAAHCFKLKKKAEIQSPFYGHYSKRA